MNIQRFKNRKGILIIACMVAILAIYSVDIFKLSYRLAAWREFTPMPVEVAEIQSFVADTPAVIGYKEPGGEMVSCAEAVAYVKTNAGETYRCCDTGNKISCRAGEFSNEIPAFDDKCTSYLRNLFGAPVSLENTTDYKFYGDCPSSSSSSLTVVQLDSSGQIRWKFVNTGNQSVFNSFARCILAPLLFVLAVVMIVRTVRGKSNEPIRRLW